MRCLPLIALALATAAGAAPLDRIVAVVNDGVVLQTELDRALDLGRRQIEERGLTAPPPEQLNEQVLERLVLLRLQTQRAQEVGIRVDDRELNEVLTGIAAQNQMSLADFADAVRADGMDFLAVRDQIRDEVVIGRLKAREVEGRVLVTDLDIASFLANQGAGGDREYRLSHLLVSVPEGATPAQRNERRLHAETLLARLRDGEAFAALALAESDGQQALDGGDLGWRKTDDLPELFAREAVRMKPQQVRGVLEGGSGFHILYLAEVRSTEEKRSLPETRAQHILLMPNAIRDEEQTRVQARDLHDRLVKGEEFAALAKALSDDPGSKAGGGDLGWQPAGTFAPEFEQALNALQPGQMSAPFRSQFGWHIARVNERRDRDITADVRRARARQAIQNRKVAEEYELWLRRLRAEAYVENRLKPEAAVVTPTEEKKS